MIRMNEPGTTHAVATWHGNRWADLRGFLRGQPVKILEQTQLERRGMDGIAAEVAQKVTLFFQYHHVDGGSG